MLFVIIFFPKNQNSFLDCHEQFFPFGKITFFWIILFEEKKRIFAFYYLSFMVKVSIILPVYGVEPYIEKCTKSLLSQTLQDMEFIFVDDHSPDNSIAVVKKIIKGHPREHQFVFLQTAVNGGAGPARNYGLQHASGEYVGFVDGDDWVSPDGFALLYEKAKSCDADMCYGAAVKNFLDGHPDAEVRNPTLPDGEIPHDAHAAFLANYVSFFTTFIYRRSMLEHNRLAFYEGGWSEDSYFLATALLTAKRFASIPNVFYHYVIRPGSASTSIDESKYLKRMAVFDDVLRFSHEKGYYNSYSSEIDFMYIKKGGLSTVDNYVHNCASPQTHVVRTLASHLFDQIPDATNNIYVKKKPLIRIALLLLKHCPRFFTFIIRILHHE